MMSAITLKVVVLSVVALLARHNCKNDLKFILKKFGEFQLTSAVLSSLYALVKYRPTGSKVTFAHSLT
jgi:hypothetical protein